MNEMIHVTQAVGGGSGGGGGRGGGGGGMVIGIGGVGALGRGVAWRWR